VRDASWLAVGIQIVLAPITNLMLGAGVIAAQHWGLRRDLSVRGGPRFKLAVLCVVLIAIGVDIALIDAVPKHGC
jgi:hypothetical protein